MRHIVSIVYSSSRNNFETQITFRGKPFRISQFGADFNPEVMKALISKFDGQCDVIAISGFHPPVTIGRKTYHHVDSQKYLTLPKTTPVTSGFLFRKTYLPWAIRSHAAERGAVVFHQRISFISGLVQQELANVLSEFSERIYFADPLFHFNVPVVLKGMEQLELYAKRVVPWLRHKTMSQTPTAVNLRPKLLFGAFREFLEADLLVATATLLERVDPRSLKGKTLLVDILPDSLRQDLVAAGVRDVVTLVPQIESTGSDSRLNYAILEALVLATKASQDRVSQDDILTAIQECKMRPQVRSLSMQGIQRVRKFAFIVHPLSVRDLFRHPLLRPLEALCRPLEGPIEKGLSKLPGITYGKITGVRSELTGERVEGTLYTLFDTPRQLLAAPPQKVYEKLVRICERAADEGAVMIGLGAFTKIVGDAGVTVASQSPIPVTTGNSLSAAATLWAARVACHKLGFLPPFKKGTKIAGTAMVIGATGSIGAVSARLLAKVASRLVLTGPRGDKLLELKEEIEKSGCDVDVVITTNSEKYAGESDLIVVSTSSIDGKVLDLSKVKPGCVICDVSRPLSFTPDEAMTRPDVLIIESGELNLPGLVDLSCDIGLEESVVYACLAETALLALEGRIESFTLSRNIDHNKVGEIYDIAKKHGAKLATIRGPSGVITDQEIDLCREHALVEMRRRGMLKEPPRELRIPGAKVSLRKLLKKERESDRDPAETGVEPCPENTFLN